MNPHSFSVELATKLGVEKAIILNRLWFWHEGNKSNGQNYHKGEYWITDVVKRLDLMLPYFSKKKIYNLLESLERDDLIKSGHFSKNKFDRTKQYALTEKSINMFTNL